MRKPVKAGAKANVVVKMTDGKIIKHGKALVLIALALGMNPAAIVYRARLRRRA